MSRRALAVYAFLILLFGVFCYLASRFDYFPGDLSISSWIQGIDFAGVKPIMQFAPYALILATLIALRLWLPLRRLGAIFIALTALAVVLASWLLKLLVGRPHPDIELVRIMGGSFGSSFPSMHLACVTVICGLTFYLAPRWLKTPAARWFLQALLIALILFTGLSRLYLGTHWASDAVGGLFLAGLLLYPAIVLYNRYDTKPKRSS